jgi:Anti-sigma-K factor rskA, C-terminal
MTSEEERMAMLAGRPLDALDDDERAQVESWTRLLADDATWVEPAPDLEDLVVASTSAAPRPTTGWASTSRRTTSWVRPLLAGLVAAAAIVFAVFLLSHRGDKEVRFATGQLAGTELAISATGRTVVYKDTSGFRIELRAHHLPRLDDGRYYQAWLKGPTGTVPIGTFSEGRGDWVTLWSGVSPVDYPMLTVTIEEPDGNQASSGHKVLSGNLSLS